MTEITFSSMEGLTAISAYGVIIIANSYLCGFIRRIILEELQRRTDFHLLLHLFLWYCSVFWGIAGISFVACRVGNIIINSEICAGSNIGVSVLAVGIALAATMFIPQFGCSVD